MVYSKLLALRIRHFFSDFDHIEEKKMFGGIGFMLGGHLCVGVWKTSLIVRLGPERAEVAIEERFVVEFDITGRPMRGWALVEAEGVETDELLAKWIGQAVDFVQTLPPK